MKHIPPARRTVALLLVIVVVLTAVLGITLGTQACARRTRPVQYTEQLEPQFNSFHEIPGITEEEIAAIEKLQEEYESFTYAMTLSSEAFIREDGTIGGYSALFTDWLTGLFGIPFEVVMVETAGQYEQLSDGAVDFSGNIVPTPERADSIFATDTIAERQLFMLHMEGSPGIDEILAERPVRLSFISSPIEAALDVAMEPGSYEPTLVSSLEEAFDLLERGLTDAYVGLRTSEVYFAEYPNVVMEDFFPLSFVQISMAASKNRPELEPVISAVTKALRGGELQYISHLYIQGNLDYRKHKTMGMLTANERFYIETTPVTPVGSYTNSYPVSFFDAQYKDWDGIYTDLLREVSLLTGLNFEIVNEPYDMVPDLINGMRDGEIHILPDVAWTRDRDEFTLWSDISLMTDYYALISSYELHDLALNEIQHYRVGLGRNTNHAELFMQWFPHHTDVVWYDNMDRAIDALIEGEVDLVMSTQRRVMYLTHYLELAGYKANYVFNYPIELRIAFSEDEPLLKAIFDKATSNIDTERIVSGWMQRSYDYRTQVAEAQRPWLIGSAVLAVVVMILVVSTIFNIQKSRIKAADREAQREYEERIQFLFDITPMGIIFIDKNKENTLVNEYMVKLLGLRSKQEYMEKFLAGISPERQPDGRLSTEKGEELITKAFEEGQSNFEWVHRRPDGAYIFTEATLIGLNYKGDDIVAGFIRDLSEEKATEEKIRRTEEDKLAVEEAHKRLERLLGRLPVGVVILDVKDNFKILFANKAILGISGYQSYAEVAEHSMLEFMPEEQADGSLTADCLKQMYDDKTSIMELICLTRNGEDFPARFTPQKITYGGGRNLMFVIENIAEEHKRRQMLIDAAFMEQEANQLKSKFLAMISHEIRTPMNAVLGMTEIELQNENLPPGTTQSLERIYDSGNMLLGIINDILDLSKIEAGKMEINTVDYDLASLLNDSLQICLVRFEDKPIEFILDVDENTPLNLRGDELRINQILNNILTNAFKYTEKGTIKLSVASGSEIAGIAGESVIMMFRVSDTGIGMTKEQLDFLFSEYTRFHIDANRTSTGTGIGLNITKHLLDLMGGEITVESEPGKGSVFTVYIPQTRTDFSVCKPELFEQLRNYRPAPKAAKKRKAPEPVKRERKMQGSVLIVDDITSNILVAKGLMRPYGLEIDTANSGFEAIDKVGGGKNYDIVFMDHMMPKMSGIEAANRLREMGYKGSIVMLTANALAGDSEKYMELGFDGYLSKPINTIELDAIIRRYIV